jgi:hypothetical protein
MAMQACLLSFINKIHLPFKQTASRKQERETMQFQGFLVCPPNNFCVQQPAHYANVKHLMAYPVGSEISPEDWQCKYVVPLEMRSTG